MLLRTLLIYLKLDMIFDMKGQSDLKILLSQGNKGNAYIWLPQTPSTWKPTNCIRLLRLHHSKISARQSKAYSFKNTQRKLISKNVTIYLYLYPLHKDSASYQKLHHFQYLISWYPNKQRIFSRSHNSLVHQQLMHKYHSSNCASPPDSELKHK